VKNLEHDIFGLAGQVFKAEASRYPKGFFLYQTKSTFSTFFFYKKKTTTSLFNLNINPYTQYIQCVTQIGVPSATSRSVPSRYVPVRNSELKNCPID
jgi:hypothetical protein